MGLVNVDNLELLELYKEEKSFTEYLEKLYTEAKKELEASDE